MKGMVLPGTLFEEMGFNYIGPIDGHDVKALVRRLRNCGTRGRSSCTWSRKGRATRPPRRTRSSGTARGRSIRRAAPSSRRRAGPTYSQIFGEWLCDMAAARPAHHRHHAGDARRLGARRVLQALPGAVFRCRDCRAACGDVRRGPGGRRPEAGGRDLFHVPAAGVRSADPRCGACRICRWCSRWIAPGWSAVTARRIRAATTSPICAASPTWSYGSGGRERVPADALHRNDPAGPSAVRYPRGAGPGVAVRQEMTALPVGRGEIRREGRSGLALLAFGALVDSASKIAERLDATLVNMRFIKPLNEDLVMSIAARHRAIVTVEENATAGGAGSAIGELLVAEGIRCHSAPGNSGSLHRTWLARGLSRRGRPRSAWTFRRYRALVGASAEGSCALGERRLKLSSIERCLAQGAQSTILSSRVSLASACAASRTFCACPGTFTLRHSWRNTPSASMRKVLRSMPRYFRP